MGQNCKKKKNMVKNGKTIVKMVKQGQNGQKIVKMGRKDEVKRLEGPPARSRAPEGPLDF